MDDIDRALADIAAIRQQVSASTLFQGLGPAALAATGLLALGVAVLQSVLAPAAADDRVVYFTVWIATAVGALSILGGEVLRRRRASAPSPLADAVLLNAIQQFVPAGMAGAMLLVAFASFMPDALWMLPGLWQILVALGIFASTRLLPGQQVFAAAWYFIAGFCVLVLASRGADLSPWYMGVPFFVGQTIMAVVTWRATEHPDAQ